MERPQLLAGGALLAGVVLAAVLVASGAGPAVGGGSTATPTAATPAPTPTATPSAADAPTAATTTETGPGWSFAVDSIESCGGTCRNVTATLRNNGSATREGVTVTTRIYADGEQLWSGTNDVGTLAAGASNTASRRVDVGIVGGAAIQANDGYVTVETVVRWDGGTTTFRQRQQVA